MQTPAISQLVSHDPRRRRRAARRGLTAGLVVGAVVLGGVLLGGRASRAAADGTLDRPATPIAQVVDQPRPGRLVTVRGVVAERLGPDYFVLRDPSGSVLVRLGEAAGGETAVAALGAELVVVGEADPDAQPVVIHATRFGPPTERGGLPGRRLGQGNDPGPASLAELLAHAAPGQRVAATGRVLAVTDDDAFVLRDATGRLTVRDERSLTDRRANPAQPGQRLRVTGELVGPAGAITLEADAISAIGSDTHPPAPSDPLDPAAWRQRAEHTRCDGCPCFARGVAYGLELAKRGPVGR